MTAQPGIRPNPLSPAALKALLPWLPVIIGLAVLYVPSLVDLFSGIWATDEQLHGPIVLGISVWLIYRNWGAMLQQSQGHPAG